MVSHVPWTTQHHHVVYIWCCVMQFTSVTRVVVAVLSLDGTATVENESLMSVMTALLETLPQCKPDLAPALLQSLSASIQRLRRHTAMCFALYEQQHVLEALAVAIYSTEGLGASLSSALLSVVDTPLGLIWLNNTGLVEFAAQELFARCKPLGYLLPCHSSHYFLMQASVQVYSYRFAATVLLVPTPFRV